MNKRQYIIMSLLSGAFGLLLYLVFGGHGALSFNETGRYRYIRGRKFDTKTGALWELKKKDGKRQWVRRDGVDLPPKKITKIESEPFSLDDIPCVDENDKIVPCSDKKE